MVGEAVQSYVSLVTGLTKATRDKARSTALGLLSQVGLDGAATDAGERVSKLADEILSASRANRELLENLVAAEVTKAASRLGFVRSEDLDEVREEIAEVRVQLERQIREATSPSAPVGAVSSSKPAGEPSPVPDPTADAGA